MFDQISQSAYIEFLKKRNTNEVKDGILLYKKEKSKSALINEFEIANPIAIYGRIVKINDCGITQNTIYISKCLI